MSKYHLTIENVEGVQVNTETDDLELSLKEFQPQFIKNKVLVTVKSDKKEVSKLLFVALARRLFYNEFARKLFARNIERSLA